MAALASSLLSVFLVILVGFGARVSGVIAREAWDGFDRVTYYILFPALIGGTLAMSDLRGVGAAAVGATLSASVLTMAAILLGLRPLLQRALAVEGPAFCSVFQGATRWNSFVAIGLAGSLYGRTGIALAAVAAVAMVPLLNVSATLVHARYAVARRPRWPALIRSILTNPFVWSSIAGAAWNLLGPPIPAAAGTAIDILGRAALGAGLLCVGAGLDATRLSRPSPALLVSLTLKLFAMPLIAFGWALGWSLDGAALAVVMLCASVPTASGSYVMARQLGGDAPLMAEILTIQTLAAMLTLPLMMTLAS